MEEQIVTFETAKLANKLGFHGNCNNIYTIDVNEDVELCPKDTYIHDHIIGVFQAPTQALLQRWLREVKSIVVWVRPVYYNGWNYAIEGYLSNGKEIKFDVNYDLYSIESTFESALETALQEALKQI